MFGAGLTLVFVFFGLGVLITLIYGFFRYLLPLFIWIITDFIGIFVKAFIQGWREAKERQKQEAEKTKPS